MEFAKTWLTYEQGFQREHTQILSLSERKGTKVLNEVLGAESFRDPDQNLRDAIFPTPFCLVSEFAVWTAAWA